MTWTDTFTPTVTNTPTDTYTPTITMTPTETYTPTNTPTADVVFYSDKNYIDLSKGEKLTIRTWKKAGITMHVKIYNLTGELIDHFEFVTAVDGWNHIEWEGKNRAKKLVGRGMYFIHVQDDRGKEVRKVYVIK